MWTSAHDILRECQTGTPVFLKVPLAAALQYEGDYRALFAGLISLLEDLHGSGRPFALCDTLPPNIRSTDLSQSLQAMGFPADTPFINLAECLSAELPLPDPWTGRVAIPIVWLEPAVIAVCDIPTIGRGTSWAISGRALLGLVPHLTTDEWSAFYGPELLSLLYSFVKPDVAILATPDLLGMRIDNAAPNDRLAVVWPKTPDDPECFQPEYVRSLVSGAVRTWIRRRERSALHRLQGVTAIYKLPRFIAKVRNG